MATKFWSNYSLFAYAFLSLATMVPDFGAIPLKDENSSTNCTLVYQIFQSKNISGLFEPINGEKLKVCQAKETCCTQEMENHLKLLVKKQYHTMLQHHVQSVQGVIASTAIHFQDYIHQMMLKAENKTLKIFNDLFNTTSIAANDIVSTFYQRLDKYLTNRTNVVEDFAVLSAASSRPFTLTTNVNSYVTTTTSTTGADQNVRGDNENRFYELTSEFFTGLFPTIYELNLNTASSTYREFHADYRTCLERRLNDIKPFGEPAKMLEKDIAKTLQATKILIASLYFGRDVLNQSSRLIIADTSAGAESCYQALLKMSSCSLCNGHPRSIKPCSGYCSNVMQGCLVRYSSELDAPWNGFYEAVDKLISIVNSGQSATSLEDLLRNLHLRIAEAMRVFLSQNQNVHNKVKYSCGLVRWLNNSNNNNNNNGQQSDDINSKQQDSSSVNQSTAIIEGADSYPDWNMDEGDLNFRSTLLSNKVNGFKESVSKSRGFYSNLANILCSDESFAEVSESAKCWNGQRVGEYTKAVVSNIVSSQKYNPEIPWSTTNTTDPIVMQLADKLRRVRQIVLSQVSLNPESDSFNQMSAEEGSGNGATGLAGSDEYNDDEDSKTEWPDQGSGSGDIPPNENGPLLDNSNGLGVHTRILSPPDEPLPDGGGAAGGNKLNDNNVLNPSPDSKKSSPSSGSPASSGVALRTSLVVTLFYSVSFTMFSCYYFLFVFLS